MEPGISSNKSATAEHEVAFEWPRQAMREQNWQEAAWRWSVMRKAYPGFPAPLFQGASACIQAGELALASTLLEHGRKEYPSHPMLMTELAALAMRQKQLEVAEDLLLKARDQHPDVVATWLKSAECAEAMGELERAAGFSETACQCAPDLPGPYIQYAEQAMRNEQWQQALERWQVLRNHFPDIPAGYLRAAEAARKLNQPEEARRLMLTHQYGPEFFVENSDSQNKLEQSGGRLAALSHFLELVWVKATLSLRSEVNRNYLSYGWWVLEPLLYMLVYYLVFSLLLNRGGDNYAVFLLTGLIPWMWFAKAVNNSSNSILAGQNLMLQVDVPVIFFPLVMILQSTIKQIPVFLLLFCFVWSQGYDPAMHWWGAIPVMMVQAIIMVAFSCAVAAIIPFIRDFSYLVPTGLTFLMFLSGIFYDYKAISEEWQGLFLLNPMAFLLKCYRDIFIEGVPADFVGLAMWGLVSSIACLLLVLIYQRLSHTYPRIVLE